VPEEMLPGCICRGWFFLYTSESSGKRRLALGVAADTKGASHDWGYRGTAALIAPGAPAADITGRAAGSWH